MKIVFMLFEERQEATTSTPVISIDEEEGCNKGDGGMSTMSEVGTHFSNGCSWILI